MTVVVSEEKLQRLAFLVRVSRRESEHLQQTDRRLFAAPFTVDDAVKLAGNPDLAERVEAFASRLARLQDTLGDKLLPNLLAALGEKTGPVVDNLDRAERLGWLSSVDDWFAMRQLRNQMVHEYIEDPAVLADALNAGHRFVPTFCAMADRVLAETDRRFGFFASPASPVSGNTETVGSNP